MARGRSPGGRHGHIAGPQPRLGAAAARRPGFGPARHGRDAAGVQGVPRDDACGAGAPLRKAPLWNAPFWYAPFWHALGYALWRGRPIIRPARVTGWPPGR